MHTPTRGGRNLTEQRGELVRKSYLGPDAEVRLATEWTALVGLRGRFPAPLPAMGTDRGLLMRFVPGVPGHVAVEAGLADRVLALCGRLRLELDSVEVAGLSGSGVVVHGDFGPQNLLVTPTAEDVVAVVDWEWCRLGDPVEDLAWAEWTVRVHHPAAVCAVEAMYAAYGARPAWSARWDAMMAACLRCRDFCERGGNAAGVASWDERIARTATFRDR
ncbi:phosphotransferase [Actinosynnema sp. NPDC020468]|uniref:phosphotransferase family protein n=1 Tax=Actinosynnema sp. NPDC020468 TaxID=3154488 RepID=UPI0033CBE908